MDFSSSYGDFTRQDKPLTQPPAHSLHKAPRASLRHRLRSIALFEQLGPGLITGAADDDPSGIATYSQAGAQFGYNMLWTMVLTYPLMCAVQLVAARIGRVTGKGLAVNLQTILPRWAVTLLVALLFFANTVNLGADFAAMGEAAELGAHIERHWATVGMAGLSLLLQMFMPYGRYAKILKYLTFSLFAYVAVVFLAHVNWAAALKGVVLPSVQFNAATLTLVVAILGTTISPYLFFWQAAEEVEEVAHDPKAKPLIESPGQARRQLKRIRTDTLVGMAASNLVAIAIMISTAATLHAMGKTNIATAAEAAEALKPVAGPFASLIFSIGIIGTGLLAAPVLAGSSAYAIGESRGWECGLDRKPWEAVGFYTVISLGVVLGVAMGFTKLDPIKALFWSAVINGVIAVPIMAAMMVVAHKQERMGGYTAGRTLLTLGWGAAGLMGLAVALMLILGAQGGG